MLLYSLSARKIQIYWIKIISNFNTNNYQLNQLHSPAFASTEYTDLFW